MRQIAVVGAGVIGLSTAVRLQREIPGIQVTVIADRLNEGTLSDGAAGIFRPNWELLPGVPEHKARQWAKDSFAHFHSLLHSEEAGEAGVSMIHGYYFTNTKPKEPMLIKDIVYHVRECSERDFATYPAAKQYKYGHAITTIMAECKWYLPYLMKKYMKNGGKLQIRKIESFEEFAGKYDVVVNATGFGSKELLNDKQMVPIRGQMVRMNAPWIKTFVFSGNHNSWVVPGKANVIVGGTRQMGNTNIDFSEEDKEGILKRAYEMVPSLKKGEVQWSWVGLRPHREPVRVEKEVMTFGNKQVKVIHNYGHGGHGVGLSWGCAGEAVNLVQSLLQNSKL